LVFEFGPFFALVGWRGLLYVGHLLGLLFLLQGLGVLGGAVVQTAVHAAFDAVLFLQPVDFVPQFVVLLIERND
jgi:hypothetical protein